MALQIDGLTIGFPAKPGYLTVSRLNAAAVGAAAGFDIDELDDLRLAVNEAVTWLLADEHAGGAIELVLHAEEGRVSVAGARTGSDLPARRSDDLIQAILGATVDEFELVADPGDQRRIRLLKLRARHDVR